MATAVSPEVQLMRRRIRHIHIPDLPPVYAPRRLAPAIRDHIQGQITRQRALAEEPQLDEHSHGLARITSNIPTTFTSWVKRAGPPPTVLSFTRRPTYILPKHQVQRQEPWQIDFLKRSLQSRMNIHFPEPPGWSSWPWRPSWERKSAESEWKHDPLNHSWPEVGVLVMPCAEAMFLGPGQVSIWPIIDLEDDIQRGQTNMKTKYEYERILEDTTVEILKREFGIFAFAIPGSTGVWVESRVPPPEVDVERAEGDNATSRPATLKDINRRANVRRIATVHTSITNNITQWGVSIHVGQPDPTLDSWTRSTNPWTPIRQHNTTTSIAAELAYAKSSASPLGPSRYLLTHFNQNAMPARAGQGAMPYSLIKAHSGQKCPAPLGMDNRDISTAWTYEFARQLGIRDGYVDHYSIVDTNDSSATNLPTKASEPGFKFNGVFSEDVMNNTFRQVEVPGVLVGQHEKLEPEIMQNSMRIEEHDGKIDPDTHDGWLLSWPLWQATLLRKLDDAICGGPCDTRLQAYRMQQQVSSRLQRRRNELRQAKEVEEEWRAEMPHLIRRPMTDSIIRDLADRSREMESILKTVRIGTKSAKLLHSTIQIRRLLEKRFAGAFSSNAAATEPEQSGPLTSLEAMSDADMTARNNTPAKKGTAQPSPSAFQLARSVRSSAIRPLGSVLRNQPGTVRSSLATSEAQGIPLPPRRKEHGESVDLTETTEKRRIRKLQERVKDRVTPRPRVLVEFTKPNAEEKREKFDQQREERLRRAKERKAAGSSAEGTCASAVPGASQFLPKTYQLGWS